MPIGIVCNMRFVNGNECIISYSFIVCRKCDISFFTSKKSQTHKIVSRTYAVSELRFKEDEEEEEREEDLSTEWQQECQHFQPKCKQNY